MAGYRYSLALGLALVSPAMLSAPDPLDQTVHQEEVMPANSLIEQAVEDLAQREAVPASTIEVVSFEAVTWPDTSMGCPHPAMRYQQVPQDGARIVLRLHGELRVYHSGGRRRPFLCEQSEEVRGIPKAVQW